ncbi:uncharacterized mitochondrial protein AtMg00860-like [Cryptomeria japonica]|uniref:uncharacterized mitochondrial protein AtMg00860-like n=1 Tax=Cryptomeria japonica TaxID=3369 RepID=UPI0027DA920E|nr:uncharacterized mitochondrial protein AtMg00860-like [Cryptomeria japonica]
MGLFEWFVMPFGLTNAPATFMQLMYEVFRDCLDKFVIIYLDDILIFSKTWKENLQHLERVLCTLQQNSLYANFSKCSFGQTSISYLGYIIDAHGVQVDPVKVEVLFKWPTPSNITELRSFLGLANFYRKFILHYSDIATPLHQLKKTSVAFKWTKIHSQVFNTLKEKLCSTPVLVLPDLSQPFEIETDASHYALGAILKQNDHHVAYHSEKFSFAKRNYSTNDKELYALVQAINY